MNPVQIESIQSIADIRSHLLAGQAIPALPLALSADRSWNQQRQRAVIRYYMDAGVGGLAVAVHSTQFEIRDPQHALFEPVLELARETITDWGSQRERPFLRIAGICGNTQQALAEAGFAASREYHAALLSLAAWKNHDEDDILRHCHEVAKILPLIGFYLQTAVGGRPFSYGFWRKFAEIENLVAIKIAPFNRYQSLDVVRAIIEAGRDDVALYTGNDDNIIADLLTPFQFNGKTRYISGGLLGQWGVWTKRAVALLDQIKAARSQKMLDASWWTMNAALTDANAAVFDAANNFAGCVPGIHEVLRRQGIFDSIACLNPHEKLSPGQAQELDRVSKAYPWLTDDDFIAQNLSRWLAP